MGSSLDFLKAFLKAMMNGMVSMTVPKWEEPKEQPWWNGAIISIVMNDVTEEF